MEKSLELYFKKESTKNLDSKFWKKFPKAPDLDFKKKHPKAPDRGTLLAAYASCQAKVAKSAEAAYKHYQTCKYCKIYIRNSERTYREGLYISHKF